MRSRRTAFALPFSLFLAAASPQAALAGDLPAGGQTLQLGSISVQGDQKIVETLRDIKHALRAPFTDDPAHADDVVCRIEKQLGEAREYLDCATNRSYSRRRDATQISVATGTLGVPGGADLFKAFVALQPEQRLHVPVNGAGLQELLQRIPDASLQAGTAPVQGPAASPAAATRAAPAPAAPPDTWNW
jgi:hypothetical protein